MPGIKYKGTDGQWHLLNNVMVNAIDVVQTTGTSTADVMSQSAVTEAVVNVSNTIATHTNNGDIHLTQTEKDNIDSLTGHVGTMAYENTSSYSSATQVSTALSEKSNTGHTHTKSEITDFPSSMPASDVYEWAKAATKPSYSVSEITNLQTTLDGKVNTGVTISAGTGLSGGGDLSTNRTISLAMPTTYSAETYTSSTITSSEPVVYALVRYTGTTALANQVCPVTLADGQQSNVIYQSANNNAYDAVISTDYVEPDGQAITLNVPAGGYAEINYINIKGIIFVRGI